MKDCPSIARVLSLVQLGGSSILNISKSELMDKVIWMDNQLTSWQRDQILLERKDLLYEKTKDKPHDPPCEYFACNDCKVVIIFPYKTAK